MSDYTNLFSPCESGSYFLAHSIGLMPLSTEQAIQNDFVKTWSSGRADAWPVWLEAIAEFKEALAILLNANSSEFSPQSNISSGLSKVLSSLPEPTGKKTILLTEHDFPSASFVLQQTQRLGYRIKIIPLGEDLQDVDTWRRYLNDDIVATLITHVHYNTNKLVPVEQISKLCRACNILSIVDIAQSVGVVPIDLDAWKVDVVVGSCIKWLCGGPGAGFLWVRPSLVQSLQPIDVGWFSHQNPFEFDIHHFQYAEDCSRFWGGTPSVLPYVVANNSIRLISKIGIDVIRGYNNCLQQKIVDAVDTKSIVSPVDRNHCGGTIVLKFDQQEMLERSLNEAEILFDAREFGIRLSPHIYTAETQVDELIAVLGQFT